VAGMIFFHYRDHISLCWKYCGFLATLSAVLYWTPFFEIGFLAFLSYLVFLVGFRALPRFYGYNRLGDYSYGIYIYAFPAQQTAAYFFPGISAFAMFCIVTPVVVALSIVSWHFIEEPALKTRLYFGTKLSNLQLQILDRVRKTRPVTDD
jgi:peptidoglycan/LPS O-acetylase OafA/YrhL